VLTLTFNKRLIRSGKLSASLADSVRASVEGQTGDQEGRILCLDLSLKTKRYVTRTRPSNVLLHERFAMGCLILAVNYLS
jgi:hypothetical protein